MKKQVKGSAALLSVMLLMSACGAEGSETGGSEAAQAQNYEAETSVSANEEPVADTSIKSETAENKGETESVLPSDMTMDDLLNMVQINGKTLTMPATLDNIMALDDGFSYELAFADHYESIEEYYKSQGHLFYDIFYNGVFVMQASVVQIEDFENVSSAKIEGFPSGFGRDMTDAGLELNLSCGIDLGSNSEDVIAIFGEQNNNFSRYHGLKYEFNDSDRSCRVDFSFRSKASEVDPEDEMRAIYIYYIDNE